MNRPLEHHGLAALVATATQSLAEGDTLVLATIIATEGSSYRKSGARMIMHADGSVSGLLGGGCFEGDLAERAREVFADGQPRQVRYDMRSDGETLWGLGLGCNGAVDIFLQGLTSATVEQLGQLSQKGGRLVTLIDPGTSAHPPGQTWIADEQDPDCDGVSELAEDGGARVFVDTIRPLPELLLCGAGPDALPLAAMAAVLGWPVRILDHRPDFARRDRFPTARQVALFEGELPENCRNVQAAVIMSHHFETDLRYLRALAPSACRYLGVLGPSQRRQALVSQVDEKLAGRVYGPIGLDLGGPLPEDIALSALAQIQAVLQDRSGDHLSRPGAEPER